MESGQPLSDTQKAAAMPFVVGFWVTWGVGLVSLACAVLYQGYSQDPDRRIVAALLVAILVIKRIVLSLCVNRLMHICGARSRFRSSAADWLMFVVLISLLLWSLW